MLADDANSIRSAIRHILGTEPAIELIGEVINFPQALELCAELKPTVLRMPGEQFEAERER